MSAPDTSGPAFPAPDLGEQDFGQRGAYPGMSLRDYFAAKAMNAIVSAVTAAGAARTPEDAQVIASASYLVADAMLKARQ